MIGIFSVGKVIGNQVQVFEPFGSTFGNGFFTFQAFPVNINGPAGKVINGFPVRPWLKAQVSVTELVKHPAFL
ncbi:hypothetical protein D3C87_1888250 [compost metagenome]